MRGNEWSVQDQGSYAEFPRRHGLRQSAIAVPQQPTAHEWASSVKLHRNRRVSAIRNIVFVNVHIGPSGRRCHISMH
jgi:hypothetical protein